MGMHFTRILRQMRNKACTAVEPPLLPTTMERCLLETTEQCTIAHRGREESWCAKSSRPVTTQAIRKQDYLFSACH